MHEIFIGLIISAILIVIWIIWVQFFYRWSNERLSELIIKKASILNKSFLADGTHMFQCENLNYFDNKVEFNLILKDASTLDTISITKTTYEIKDECSLTSPCIKV